MRELRPPPPSSLAEITPLESDTSDMTGSPFWDLRSILTRPSWGSSK